MVNTTKTCIKCGETKQFIEFYNRKANKDGKQGSFKKCTDTCTNEYFNKNKQKIYNAHNDWRKNNKEKLKKYYINNKQKINERNTNWRNSNKEHICLYAVEYRKDHVKQTAENNHNWKINNKEKRKKLNKKAHTKRKRNLGFIPLNKKFDGADGHHIDKQHVVYIPKELHMSIPHNQNNIESMEKINELTLNWMLGV